MTLASLIRAGRFLPDAKFNPDGKFNLIVLALQCDMDMKPPLVKSIEWRLVSSKDLKPARVLTMPESAEIMVVFFNQNSFSMKVPATASLIVPPSNSN